MSKAMARLLRGIDPEELASQIAVHHRTVRLWKNGQTLPFRRILPALSLATGIPLKALRTAYDEDRARRKEASDSARAVTRAS